jgi:hypothetical protein
MLYGEGRIERVRRVNLGSFGLGMERRQHEVEQERIRRHRRHPNAAAQTLEA